ncbi:MAG: response regulator [Deltaproteobacteria bacterium]|nr:response regulator [Deltaproteobacteria bacterium]
MDRAELTRRLMATFLGEAEEHLAALNRGLLALERAAGAEVRVELLRTLFRAAHSLKGAARAVGARPIEGACHGLEEMLGAARDGRIVFDSERYQLLFALVDAVQVALEQLREPGGPVATSPGTPAALAARQEEPAAGPPNATPAPAGAASSEVPASPTARVAVEHLDELVRQSGELLRVRGRLAARVEALGELAYRTKSSRTTTREELAVRLGALERGLEETERRARGDLRQLERVANALEAEARSARLLPLGAGFEELERLVADLCRATGREADLVATGKEVALDRALAQRLQDPLRHLVRNAVDHGLEPRPERVALGKPPRGRLEVTARLCGAQAEVTVADDGRGLDLPALRRRAAELGLTAPRSDAEAAELVWLPGLSTARRVDAVSGRGVGLDVVKATLEGLHGTAAVESIPGRGTRFTIAVPLTLATLRVLLVAAGGQRFALPLLGVRRLLRLEPEELDRAEEGTEAWSDGPAQPVAHLASLLGRAPSEQAASRRVPVVLLGAGAGRLALVVDELLDEREVTVRPLGPRLEGLRFYVSGTVLPDGAPALVLNVPELVRAGAQQPSGVPPRARPASAPGAVPRCVLVVDDSATTRALGKSILEAAGYAVRLAVDGADALRVLAEGGVELVISDVEMPRMDGFELTATIRSTEALRHLPVVLLTARDSVEDRARGRAVGADAYMVKAEFDPLRLLDTLARLLRRS